MQSASPTRKIFEAISAGNAEDAASLLLNLLAAQFPTSELLGQMGLIKQDLEDKLALAQSEEEKQRIRTHCSAKLLDILDQVEKMPTDSTGYTVPPYQWLPKALLMLLIIAMVLILIEVLTW